MANQKVVAIVVFCLVASPAIAMKRAGSTIESDVPSKRFRIGTIAPNRKEQECASILTGLDMSIKPDVFAAIEEEDFYTYSALMVTGKNPNKINPADDNPLSLSAWLNFSPEQNKELYPVLKANGLDVNAATSNTGSTLSHLVAIGDDVPFFTQLVGDGADLHQENCDGETSLFYAQTPAMIHECARHGADVNHQNDKGQTPLFGVAGVEKSDSAKTLLMWGADHEITDDKGRTAYVRQQHRLGNPNPVLKNRGSVRKALMPTLVSAMKPSRLEDNFTTMPHSLAKSVFNRESSGKQMSYGTLGSKYDAIMPR